MRAYALLLFLFTLASCRSLPTWSPRPAVVLTTDFGLRDGAVSAMKGVAYGVEPRLVLSDLSHEIKPFDIGEAALRLQQTYRYWPAGTVFVTVVDPGVGSARRSVAVRTQSGHVFIGPDNGHLSLVLDEAGVAEARVIDESHQRRAGSEASYTFHGRDLYAYVGARLASGQLRFEDLGPVAAPATLVHLKMPHAEVANGLIQGVITTLDPNFGNVWTNVPKTMVEATFPNARELRVYIAQRGRKVFEGRLPLASTFAGVAKGQPLLYFNSLLNLAAAVNQGSFARVYQVGAGPEWTITISKP